MSVFAFNYFHVWKSVHFDGASAVISHMVEELERSIGQQQALFQAGPLKTEEWELGEGPRAVQFHGPFNSEAFDLDELVGLYLPSIQRGALLLLLYSTMEDQFVRLCRDIAHFHPKMSDLDRYAGIDKAVRYLEEVAQLPCLRQSKEWYPITRIGTIRNQFAHQSGRIPDTKLKAFGPQISAVTIGRGFLEDKLVVHGGYLPEAIATFDRFAGRVQNALIARFP